MSHDSPPEPRQPLPSLPPLGAAPDTEIEDTAASARPNAVLPKGTQLGRFVVLDRLGQGGMGVVYSAFDPVLERKVALKLLRLENISEEHRAAAIGRLAREARSAARLSSPHVVA